MKYPKIWTNQEAYERAIKHIFRLVAKRKVKKLPRGIKCQL